ncbi:MAG TPA: hypothetical protein VGK90_02815 [Rhizomicrobium sp.]|jgi:hypothetical protein
MTIVNRRSFAIGAGGAAAGLALAGNSLAQPRRGSDMISRSNAAIHQEVHFAAKPAQLFAALTQASEFDKVVRLS